MKNIAEMINSSPVYRDRAQKALSETCDLIAKEMRYTPELRNAEYLASLENHVKTLEGYLA